MTIFENVWSPKKPLKISCQVLNMLMMSSGDRCFCRVIAVLKNFFVTLTSFQTKPFVSSKSSNSIFFSKDFPWLLIASFLSLPLNIDQFSAKNYSILYLTGYVSLHWFSLTDLCISNSTFKMSYTLSIRSGLLLSIFL